MTAQAAISVRSFTAPNSVDDAIAARRDLGERAVFLAGGTDLGVVLRRRLLEPEHLIDLTRIDELHRLERVGDEVVVGAAVTHRRIELSPLFAGHAAALQEACATIGSVQTRSVGTIGGNLCNASPAADTAPVLLALDASVEIGGSAGRRLVALDDFFVGYRATALQPGEILISVRVPVPDVPSGSAFFKLGRRKAMEISIACVAVRVNVAEDGSIVAAGVGLGSVSPTSVRSPTAERVLLGSRQGATPWPQVGAAATDDCAPIDDVRATGAYRRAMVPILAARAAEFAVRRARGAA